jgi:hypothetical protein
MSDKQEIIKSDDYCKTCILYAQDNKAFCADCGKKLNQFDKLPQPINDIILKFNSNIYKLNFEFELDSILEKNNMGFLSIIIENNNKDKNINIKNIFRFDIYFIAIECKDHVFYILEYVDKKYLNMNDDMSFEIDYFDTCYENYGQSIYVDLKIKLIDYFDEIKDAFLKENNKKTNFKNIAAINGKKINEKYNYYNLYHHFQFQILRYHLY